MNQPQLRDIHLPETSLWWPPAPGWWLALLLLVLLALLLPRLLRWFRHKPLKRVSLKELALIRRDYENQRDEQAVLKRVAGLLRRVAISYYGRDAAAALTGAEWQRQLQRLSPQGKLEARHLELITHGRYRPQSDFEVEDLLQGCENWLRALPRRDSHG